MKSNVSDTIISDDQQQSYVDARGPIDVVPDSELNVDVVEVQPVVVPVTDNPAKKQNPSHLDDLPLHIRASLEAQKLVALPHRQPAIMRKVPEVVIRESADESHSGDMDVGGASSSADTLARADEPMIERDSRHTHTHSHLPRKVFRKLETRLLRVVFYSSLRGFSMVEQF